MANDLKLRKLSDVKEIKDKMEMRWDEFISRHTAWGRFQDWIQPLTIIMDFSYLL